MSHSAAVGLGGNMAIKYDQELNSDLRNTVRNFNKKVIRAEKRGFRNLPKLEKVSEIKARYQTRGDLERAIERLKNFKRGDILSKVENKGGAKAISWQMKFVKDNVKNAKAYFEREYERVSKRTGKFPGERTYLDTIASKINLLENNLTYMSQSQFRSALAAVNEFYEAPINREAQYRGFLSEVEWVMEKTGISQEQRDIFFKKFGSLTPSQFLYAYDNNDIIDRVYKLYIKQGDGEPYLNDPENAEEQINQLMEEADDIVNDAKANAD